MMKSKLKQTILVCLIGVMPLMTSCDKANEKAGPWVAKVNKTTISQTDIDARVSTFEKGIQDSLKTKENKQ